ncbi:MAG: hypothetical protein WBD20_20915 [Pirellulaceae bacterium]
MSKHSKTTSDVLHLAAVLLPIAILLVTVALASLSWQKHEQELHAALSEVSRDGQGIGHATVVRLHDAETSKEDVATWKEILAASQAHDQQFGAPFTWTRDDDDSYEFLVSPGETWEAGQIVHVYAENAKPILAKIETLLNSDETIWMPLVAESFYTNLSEVQHSRSVARLLRYVFLDAIHHGDNETALMTIKASHRLFGPKQKSLFLVGQLVQQACYSVMLKDLQLSLAVDVWTDEQLAEIESILSRPMNWDQRWASCVQSEIESFLPILADGKIESRLHGTNLPLESFKLAPSSFISIIRRQQQLMETPSALSDRDVDKIHDVFRSQEYFASDIAADRLLQLPMMSSEWIAGLVTPAYGALAGAFCRNANDHRFTRTLLAVRKFEHEFDRWPESLDELSRVGLPRSETQTFDGGSFATEVDENGQMVVYDQAQSTTVYESLSNQPAVFVTLVRGKNSDR